MRRALSIGIILLVAAAFTVAVITEGTGPAFLIALVAVAGILVGLVFLVAFSGGTEMHPRSPFRDFPALEDLETPMAGGGPTGGLGDHDAPAFRGGPPGVGGPWISAQAFVAALVPIPQPPSGLSGAALRRHLLADLRTEGAGLIRLAKAAKVDLAPYEAFLVDTRNAARRGDAIATLRSLTMANELLRATVERTVAKRKSERHERADPRRP